MDKTCKKQQGTVKRVKNNRVLQGEKCQVLIFWVKSVKVGYNEPKDRTLSCLSHVFLLLIKKSSQS